MTPTVYFVQSDPPYGPVKIGHTVRRVRKRVSEGKTFVPGDLWVLAEHPGTREDEARLHRVFAPHKVRGEWFEYVPDLRELVEYVSEGGSLSVWLEGR